MVDFELAVILIISGIGLVLWVLAESWDYLAAFWGKEIVSDYPYEDEL